MKLFTTLAVSAVAQLQPDLSLSDLFEQINAGLPAADSDAGRDEGPIEGIGERYFGSVATTPTDAPPEEEAPADDSVYGTGCWKCDKMSFSDCATQGEFTACSADQSNGDYGVCFIEMRENFQRLTQLCTGCKDANACNALKAQNFVGNNIMRQQCKQDYRLQRPTRRRVGVQQSTCRQCFSMCRGDVLDHEGNFCFGGLGLGESGSEDNASWHNMDATMNINNSWLSSGEATDKSLGIPLHARVLHTDDMDHVASTANHVFMGNVIGHANHGKDNTDMDEAADFNGNADIGYLYWGLKDNGQDFWSADLVQRQRTYRNIFLAVADNDDLATTIVLVNNPESGDSTVTEDDPADLL
jgi:hypothetical protein